MKPWIGSHYSWVKLTMKFPPCLHLSPLHEILWCLERCRYLWFTTSVGVNIRLFRMMFSFFWGKNLLKIIYLSHQLHIQCPQISNFSLTSYHAVLFLLTFFLKKKKTLKLIKFLPFSYGRSQPVELTSHAILQTLALCCLLPTSPLTDPCHRGHHV